MWNLSRRQFLTRSAIAGVMVSVPNVVLAASRPKLFIPPLIEVRRGKPIFLQMENMQHSFTQGTSSEVWGFNGEYLGPTIRIQKGDFAKLNYFNNLNQPVSLTIQGLQGRGELLGGIGKKLESGASWAPIIPIKQSAATCWYHSVSVANSAYQTYRGLAGLWLIEDEQTQQTSLPQKYGIDDIPLILQDISLNKKSVPLFQKDQSTFLGNQLLVNGQISPHFNVQRGWIRLRLLNASVSRDYDLRFENDHPMYLIAQDQGFLPQSKKIQQLHLAPSERAEVLVNLTQAKESLKLIQGEKRNLWQKIQTYFASEQELIDNTVLELRPQGLSAVFSEEILPALPHTDAPNLFKQPIAKERTFHFDANTGKINDQYFNPKQITSVKLGSVERWILTASSPLGFKIQGAKFVVETINDQKVPTSEVTWKDTVWIKGKVSILLRFDNTSTNTHPFIFGTSNLMLADKGCFRLLVVQ